MRYWIGGAVIIAALGLSACDTSQNGETPTVIAGLSDTAAAKGFTEFASRYKPVTLPFLLPDQDNSGDTLTVPHDDITTYFSQATFKWLVEQNETADLQQKPKGASYYYIGATTAPGYVGLITQKQTDQSGDDQATYYYLTTFTPQGKYIDGMCIAIYEKFQGDVLRRSAELKADNSIIITQSDKVAGHETLNGGIYEITDDGHIQKLEGPGGNQPS